MSKKRTAEEQIHLFEHHDLTGAVIRILDDDPHSLSELLGDEHAHFQDHSLVFSYTCCYINHRDRNIMVDGGLDGDEVRAKLAELGVAPSDIELVLITHVDRDHVAGLILQVGDGELTYPNARYAIDAGLWAELHKDETYYELPGHLRRLFKILVERLEGRVILCDGETELASEHEVFDGITFVPCPGHRPGHAAYEFATEGSPVLHMGDAFFHPLFIEQFNLPITGDSDPDQAVASRKALIARASENGALVLGTHMPWPGVGQILAEGDSAEWVQS